MNNDFEFKPFEKVLVRDNKHNAWVAANYSHYVKKNKMFKHKCTDGISHMYCIPFKNNESLLGTNKDFYIPNKGDLVLVSENNITYTLAIFEKYDYQKNVFICYNTIDTINNKPVNFYECSHCKEFKKGEY